MKPAVWTLDPKYRRVTAQWPRRKRGGTCWCCATSGIPVRPRQSQSYQVSPYKPAVDGGTHLWCAKCERSVGSLVSVVEVA